MHTREVNITWLTDPASYLFLRESYVVGVKASGRPAYDHYLVGFADVERAAPGGVCVRRVWYLKSHDFGSGPGASDQYPAEAVLPASIFMNTVSQTLRGAKAPGRVSNGGPAR
jgi:hypothetical protein